MLALLLESAVRSCVLALVVWLGLKVLRVRNPHIELTTWTVVLAAALLMPMLMQVSPLKVESPRIAAPVLAPILEYDSGTQALEEISAQDMPRSAGVTATAPLKESPVLNWYAVASGMYLAVAGVLAARLMLAGLQAWKLLRRSRPLRLENSFAARISDGFIMPATVGRTILLPREFENWSAHKRTAVLLHENCHAARGDFYVQLLASLHSAVFWFNPLAWWLQRHLMSLAEITSDEAALAKLPDRAAYAEILLDISQAAHAAPAAIAMARPATLYWRIDRILGGNAISARIARRKHTLIAACVVPIISLVTAAVAAPSRQDALEFLPRRLAVVPDVFVTPPAVPLAVAISHDIKMPHDIVLKAEPVVPAAAPIAVDEPQLALAATALFPHAVSDIPVIPVDAAAEGAPSVCVHNVRKVQLLLIIDPRTVLISPDGESFKRVTVINDPNDTTDTTKMKQPSNLCVGDKVEPLGLERGVSFIAAIEDIDEAEALAMRDARNARVLSYNRLNSSVARGTSRLCKDGRLTPLQISLCVESMEGAPVEETREELKRRVRATIKRRQAYADRQRPFGIDPGNNYNFSGNASGSNNLPGSGIGDAMSRAAMGIRQ